MTKTKIQLAIESADQSLESVNIPSASDLMGVLCLLYIDIRRTYPNFAPPSVVEASNLIKKFA